MIEAVSTAVPTVIGWVGDVVSAMTGVSVLLFPLLLSAYVRSDLSPGARKILPHAGNARLRIF